MGTWPGLYNAHGSLPQGGSVNTGSSSLAGITPGSGANAKGAWSAVLTSLDRAACGLWIQLERGVFSAADYLVDIGTGAIGSETALVDNLLFSAGGSGYVSSFDGFHGANTTNYWLPIGVQAGTRLSARAQCGIAGSNREVGVNAIAVASSWYDQHLSRVVTIGANTADSGGTPIAETGHVSAAVWTELSSSCPVNLAGFVIGIGKQNVDTTAARSLRIAIAIGAAASEVPIAYHFFNFLTDADISPQASWPFMVPIRAGQRISAWIAANASASSNGYDVILYGLA